MPGKPTHLRIGKAPRSQNAVRHGILSMAPVIFGVERHEDWEAHHAEVVATLDPVGYIEAALADRIALGLWRTGRIVAYENSLLRPEDHVLAQLQVVRKQTGHHGDPWDHAASPPRELPEPYLANLQRYEAHINRQFRKDLHELEAIQARRRGEHINLARVDVT